MIKKIALIATVLLVSMCFSFLSASNIVADDFGVKPDSLSGLTDLPYVYSGYTFNKRAIFYNQENGWYAKDYDDTQVEALQCDGQIGLCVYATNDSNPLAFTHPSNPHIRQFEWNDSTHQWVFDTYTTSTGYRLNVNHSIAEDILYSSEDIKYYTYALNPNYTHATYYGGVNLDNGEVVFSASWPPATLTFPLSGSMESRTILSSFGDDWLEYCGGEIKKHTGVDIETDEDETVYAAEAGTVKVAQTDEDWGGWVTISHGLAYTTVYWHIIPSVSVDDTVIKGDSIGTVVNYGGAVHLHFGLRKGAYSNTSNRGTLPQSICDGDPAFPENFVDPETLSFE